MSAVKHNVTVWVHGTRGSELVPVYLSQHAATVEHEICFCPPGLHAAGNLDSRYHMHTIAKVLNNTDSTIFPLSSFYIFGWTGALSFTKRKEAAQDLYTALKELVQRYEEQHGARPHVTMITHSHGGNVALNMGSLHMQSQENDPLLSIDRLILLACPVQKETTPGLRSPLFNKIYSLHSHMDALQVLDPQGFHAFIDCSTEAWSKWSLEPMRELFYGNRGRPVFSERHFEPQDNLTQVRVRWEQTHPWSDEDLAIFSEFRTVVEGIMTPYLPAQRDLLHIEFMLPSFLKNLPWLLANLEATPDSPTQTPDAPDEIDRVIYV